MQVCMFVCVVCVCVGITSSISRSLGCEYGTTLQASHFFARVEPGLGNEAALAYGWSMRPECIWIYIILKVVGDKHLTKPNLRHMQQ